MRQQKRFSRKYGSCRLTKWPADAPTKRKTNKQMTLLDAGYSNGISAYVLVPVNYGSWQNDRAMRQQNKQMTLLDAGYSSMNGISA